MFKKLICIGLILFTSTGLFAQNISYKLIDDNPEVHPKVSINLDLFHFDFNEMLDASSFNLGLYGYVELLPNRLFIDYTVRRSWFALGRLGDNKMPNHFNLEMGANYMLTKGVKKRTRKIVLKSDYKGTFYKGGGDYVEVTEVTYIRIPVNVFRSYGVRGGLYYKTNPYLFNDDQIAPLTDYGGKMSATGMYVGLIAKSAVNAFIEAEGYGVCFNSIGTDVYFDLMVLPVHNFQDHYVTGTEEREDETSTIKDALGNNPLGFRFGYKLYQIAPRKMTGKKFGLSANFEAGVKPYLGIYFSTGIGVTLRKK